MRTLNGQLLNASALPTAVVGGQGESLDAAACADTAGQHVVGVQVITTLRETPMKTSSTNPLYQTGSGLGTFRFSKFRSVLCLSVGLYPP